MTRLLIPAFTEEGLLYPTASPRTNGQANGQANRNGAYATTGGAR